jgi:hypothetical protein
MRRSSLRGLTLLLTACGDGGGDTLTASGSQTGTAISLDVTVTAGDSGTPTGTATGTGTADDSGTASLSATGTTTTTGTAPTDPTADPTTTTGPVITAGTATSTGDTSDDTGPSDFCSMPDVPAEDVPLNEACDVPLQMGSFNPVIEWKHPGTQFYGPPSAGQTIDSNNSGALDADDKPLIFLFQGGDLVALWGDGSGVAWTAIGNYGSQSGPSLGDLDGDGWNEVLTASGQQLCAFDGRDGANKWCTALPAASVDTIGYNFPAIGDMDGDGLAEIAIGRAIFDHTGALVGQGTHGKGQASVGGMPNAATYGAISALADLDADGVQELVTGNAAYDLDGNTLWFNGELDGLVAIADFDLDGQGEIVKTNGTIVHGLETDGSVAWGPLAYTGNLGTPAIDDLDGDGFPELVFGAQVGLVAMKWGGDELWVAPIQDQSGAAGPVLFDFESDGYPEVLYADEVAIRFFSGLDGSPKYLSMEHSSATGLETPIVADVDGDGHVEIVLGHGGANPQIGALTVYGDAGNTWPPGRKIWNQHTYSITNVSNLGKIPDQYQANWLPGFNSFRSADAGQPPGEYHDLLVEILGVCETQCEDGTFFMAARVRNAGNVEAPAGLPVTVRAGPGGDIVVVLDTTQPVPPGQTGEVLFFEFPASQLAQSQPVITVDDTGFGDGELFECDETNNTAVWPNLVCPTVEPG